MIIILVKTLRKHNKNKKKSKKLNKILGIKVIKKVYLDTLKKITYLKSFR